ncbi:MAG: hypothetical protein EOM53_05335 [Alphaproteobacteria bacterium]|nr:hypothetical protein [Alphaproteobacteria bacterium]
MKKYMYMLLMASVISLPTLLKAEEAMDAPVSEQEEVFAPQEKTFSKRGHSYRFSKKERYSRRMGIPRGEPSPEEDKRHEKRLAKDLDLTTEQLKVMRESREKARIKIKPLFEKMQTIRKEMDEIRKENMIEFERVLTKEQKEKMDEIKQKHMEKMRRRR